MIILIPFEFDLQHFAFSGGNGTKDNPYRISSQADLEQLAKDVNGGDFGGSNSYHGKFFKLTIDIFFFSFIITLKGGICMAYIWNSDPTGTLRVQYSGSSRTKSFAGINANVLEQYAEYAVEQLNKLLDIGGYSAIVNDSTKFTETSGVIEDE